MKLKLDENLSRHLKSILQRLGHDVETAADEGLLSQTDVLLGAAAREAGRILLTSAAQSHRQPVQATWDASWAK